MGVERTDYLMWGAKIDPADVSWDLHEEELDNGPDRRFDLVYDGMSGAYAIAGKVVVKCSQYDGINFQKVPHDCMSHDFETADAVKGVFPQAREFTLYMFSHYH